MVFSDEESFKQTADVAIQVWIDHAKKLGIHDHLLPNKLKERRHRLRDDFRLFVNFWEPNTVMKVEMLLTTLIHDWFMDRLTCECANDEERRASILIGNDNFFNAKRVETLLCRRCLAPKNSIGMPDAEKIAESRRSHVLFYGCSLTDSEIIQIAERIDSNKEAMQELKKERFRKGIHAKTVITDRWYLVPIGEDAKWSWPKAFGSILYGIHNNIEVQ